MWIPPGLTVLGSICLALMLMAILFSCFRLRYRISNKIKMQTKSQRRKEVQHEELGETPRGVYNKMEEPQSSQDLESSVLVHETADSPAFRAYSEMATISCSTMRSPVLNLKHSFETSVV